MQQSYFLGGATAGGFRTRFSEQIQQPGFYTYILKGRAGNRKIHADEACGSSL